MTRPARNTRPDAAALAELDTDLPRLRKAPADDPVLSAGAAPPRTAESAATTRVTRATTEKTRVGFYQDPADTARARAAYSWTRLHEGHRSWSDFIAAALMREVDRLEHTYNNAAPWTPVDTGELPTGRPLSD